MPQAAPQDPPAMTPLAPSVEKAYYRKCIQLKRRLNEVEAANDETKRRRLRLDRAIMKMRLERAFLLDELRKRMDQDVDGSDGSADEGMATPPPDRPHRDKRRRTQTSQPPTAAQPPTNSLQSSHTPSAQRTISDPTVGTPTATSVGGGHANSANAVADDGQYGYSDTAQRAGVGQNAPPNQPPPFPHGSPYEAQHTELSGASAVNGMEIDPSDERDATPASRKAGGTGEPSGTESGIAERAGDQQAVSEESNTKTQDEEHIASTAEF